MIYRITTNHSASKHELPVLVDDNNQAYSMQDLIKIQLDKKGWNIVRLAKEAGINQATAYNFMSGTDTQVSNLLKIFTCLNISISV